MWFQVLSWLIAVPCLLKGIIGLLLPERFYGWRHGHYTSERPPKVLFVAPLALTGSVTVTWYATAYHYVPWGWVVTVFVTAASLLGLANLLRWRKHRDRALHTVGSPATRRSVDLVLIGAGAGFVAMALAVY